jgi:hypothetical protein
MTHNSQGNLHTKMPEAAIVAAKMFLMETQPESGPQAQVHTTLIAGLNIVGQHLENIPRHHEIPLWEGLSGRSNAAGHEVAAPNNSTREEMVMPYAPTHQVTTTDRHHSSRQDIEPR